MSAISIISYAQDQPSDTWICKYPEYVTELIRFKKSLALKPAADSFNITYLNLTIQVNPDTNYLKGQVGYILYHNKMLDTLYLDFTDSLQIHTIKVNGTEKSYTHQNNLICIPNDSFRTSDHQYVWIDYEGTPAKNGFGSFSQGFHSDNKGIIWTLSQPFGTMDWMPCKNDLGDKIDSVDINVTMPKLCESACNGLLKSSYIVGENKVQHWKHRYPIAHYLVAFAVTNYTKTIDTCETLHSKFPVYHYLYPKDSASSIDNSKFVNKFIRLFDSLFIPYPFAKEKYGQAQFNWGGGMEHQTITFLKQFDFELLSHELAHHWFGDYITCATWNDIWLNEGFATYLSGVAYYLIDSKWYPIFIRNNMNTIIQKFDGAVYKKSANTVPKIFDGRLTYKKGAMVLHQLQYWMGEGQLFEAMRSYLKDSSLINGFATTEQFKTHLKKYTALDIDRYFDEYVYGEGYPSFLVQWESSKKTITLYQNTSHPSVSFYHIPLPVRFYKDNQFTDYILEANHSEQSFNIPFSGEPDSILIDPEFHVIGKKQLVTADQELVVMPLSTPGKLLVEIKGQNEKIQSCKIFNKLGQLLLEKSGLNNALVELEVFDYIDKNIIIHIQSDKGKYARKLQLN